MLVGLLTAQIEIAGALSLKDKRQVVRSLLTRIRGTINASAAEVDDLDLWQRATLGFAVVSTAGDVIDGTLEHVVRLIESEPRCRLLSVKRETL